jgi:O-antigen ligase
VMKDPRPALWREALEMVEERPLSGYGFGRGLLRDSLRDEFGRPELWHSHNLFLDAALQTGIPGVLLLLILFGATFRQGWRLARGSSLPSAVCGAVAIAVVLGTILRNSTDVLWVRQSALLYWAVMGILLAWGIRYGDQD